MEKIGADKVNEELLERGLSREAVDKLQPILRLTGTNMQKLDAIAALLAGSETGTKGVEELREVFRLCDGHTQQDNSFRIELDLTLARGLNYYTGAIFEVKALDAAMGSITGGGRYDNLTGIFGLPGVSGVGISFGADRIYDVLCDLNLFPAATGDSTQLLFVTFGQAELQYALAWADRLRSKGVNTEVYPEPAKMKKQMGYADANRIPYVAVVGENEMQTQTVMLKDMQTGEQHPVTLQQLEQAFS